MARKYITRTFNVKTGTKLVPNYDNRCFDEVKETLIDCEEIPADVCIEKEEIVLVKMPVEVFFNNGEKILVGQQEAVGLQEAIEE